MSKTTDESLARIEHKLDLALNFIIVLVNSIGGPKAGPLPPMGDLSHKCPVCLQGVKYVVDLQDKAVTPLCGCKTGKFAPLDLEQFAPPRAAGGRDGREGHNAAGEGEPQGGDERSAKGPRRG